MHVLSAFNTVADVVLAEGTARNANIHAITLFLIQLILLDLVHITDDGLSINKRTLVDMFGGSGFSINIFFLPDFILDSTINNHKIAACTAHLQQLTSCYLASFFDEFISFYVSIK